MAVGGETEQEVEISVKVKPFGISRLTQFCMNIFMVVIVLAAQISNLRSLLFTNYSSDSWLTVFCFGILCFSLFFSARNLIRDLKERRGMKQKGEEFCNVCKGTRSLGIIKIYKNLKTNKVKKGKWDWHSCKKCNGTGKIDWVQKVIDPRRLS